MQSIQNIYKIGPGPSSSHTFGPMRACQDSLSQYPEADDFHVTLFGSLALTGKGHLTDQIIDLQFSNSRISHEATAVYTYFFVTAV